MRGAEVDAVAALAVQGGVAGEHVQVPQREAGGQAVAVLFVQGDGRGELEEAEVGFGGFGAHADADEFDLRDDEAVARVAVAEEAVQVREAGEVEGLLAVLFPPHARVPDVECFDQADDAAAAEGVGLVVGVGGDVGWAVFPAALGPHGDVVLVALAGLEGRVDFGGVERGDGVLERAFVGDLEYRLVALGRGEGRGGDGDVEQAGAFFAVGEMRDGHDGGEAEVFPDFQVPDVPPGMHVLANAHGNLFNQCHYWV